MEPVRVLIVDDQPNVRAVVRHCLEPDGYAVREAADGREALAAVTDWRPRVVLLDLAMPVLDGMNTLRELRAQAGDDMPRVVVATAHGSVKAAIEALRLGADDFLEKPFSPDDLRQAIRSALDCPPLRGTGIEGGYEVVLKHARAAIRDRNLGAAESLLMMAGTINDGDPVFLNLVGLLHLERGRCESARRFFERAVAADSGYAPAQENLLRCSS